MPFGQMQPSEGFPDTNQVESIRPQRHLLRSFAQIYSLPSSEIMLPCHPLYQMGVHLHPCLSKREVEVVRVHLQPLLVIVLDAPEKKAQEIGKPRDQFVHAGENRERSNTAALPGNQSAS